MHYVHKQKRRVLIRLVWCLNGRCISTWFYFGFHVMTALLSLTQPEVVIATTSGVASDDKVDMMTTLDSQCPHQGLQHSRAYFNKHKDSESVFPGRETPIAKIRESNYRDTMAFQNWHLRILILKRFYTETVCWTLQNVSFWLSW